MAHSALHVLEEACNVEVGIHHESVLSADDRVVMLFACRARCLGFEPGSRHFDFRDTVSPPSK